jgi:sterol desaturase/sphingolipid hydroxylase (fatty acid hydroxylase superfamily)/CDGSH-type Zn-finger protein
MKDLVTQLLAIDNFDVILVLSILIGFGLMETVSGFLTNSKRKKGDWVQEILSFLLLSIGIKPAIVFSVYLIGSRFFPEQHYLFNEISFGWGLVIYLLIDDVLQYWYHRTAHETPFLWKLHRSHHQAEEMGYFVSYRNAFLYYVLMPNIWWVGLVVYSGGGKAVALGLVLKQLVIIGSHSRLRWDKPFYTYPILRPLIKVIERIIITPSFHHSHHGTSLLDEASDPNGNFGNMFSFWDQLFGTATFQTSYPSEYGLQKKTNDPWTSAYFYPFVTSPDKQSDWHKDHQIKQTATKEAASILLTKGENYLWCACGRSANQPFCDGSHHGTKIKPIKFTAKRSAEVKLCNCKKTAKGPFCDDTHLNL